MSTSARALSDLIGAVYEAGLDPTGAAWPAVLERLSPAIAGDGTVVLALERHRFEYARTHTARTDPSLVTRYQAHYRHLDPVFEPLLTRAAAGEVLFSDAVMPPSELRRTEFHADWLRPNGYGSAAATVLVRHGSAIASLFAVRPRRRGPYGRDAVATLALMLPHLATAVRTSLRLAALDTARDAVVAALDHWADAVLLVDALGGVHAANRAAEALLRDGDGIGLEPARGLGRGRLRADTPAGTAALRAHIAAAASVADAGDAASPGMIAGTALALARAAGRPTLAALVAPLARERTERPPWVASLAAGSVGASVVVLITDPAAGPNATAAQARLRATYRLTAAEASVAVDVAAGEGLLAVAAARGVTLATIRTQAQQVYRKLGLRGQAGLARIVERLVHAR